MPAESQFEGAILFVEPVLYFAAAAIGIVGSIALTVRRFQRLTA